MTALSLLAANDFELIKLVVGVVLGLIWVLNHLLAGKAKAKVPPVAKRQANWRPGDGQGEAAAATETQRTPDALSAEIEQFLKDAAQRKRGRQQRQPTGASAVRRVAGRLGAETPVEAKVLEPPTGEAIGDAVSRHLDTRRFAVRAAALSDDMKRGDLEREQHFQKAFSHKVGTLEDTSQPVETAAQIAAGEAAVSVSAASMAELLVTPQSVRQAIVLNEILARPLHRW